jgi:hypothetical protein
MKVGKERAELGPLVHKMTDRGKDIATGGKREETLRRGEKKNPLSSTLSRSK